MPFRNWRDFGKTGKCAVARRLVPARDNGRLLETSPQIVLIAEPDRATAEFIANVLHQVGLRTIFTLDLEGTITNIGEHCPDLLFLNPILLDGRTLDLCRELRSFGLSCSTPVILILKPEELSRRGRIFENCECDYITTPLVPAEIVTRMRTYLGLRQANARLSEINAEHVELLAMAQRSCMPRPEDMPDARFHAEVRQLLPAGGDSYDVLKQDGGHFDYVVADATGHSLASSFWTLAFKTLLTEYSYLRFPPLDALELVNQALLRILPDETFLTATYARLDRVAGRLTLVSAGHPPAILVPSEGRHIHVVHQIGDVIGGFGDAVFGFEEISVKKGDRFFLYTDGMVDGGNGQSEGIAQLVEALRRVRNSPMQVIVSEVIQEMTATRKDDDVVLMGVEV